MFMAQKYFEQDSIRKALNGDGQYLGFLAIIDEYGMTKSSNLSHYYAGMCYLKLGQFEHVAVASEQAEHERTDPRLDVGHSAGIKPLVQGLTRDRLGQGLGLRTERLARGAQLPKNQRDEKLKGIDFAHAFAPTRLVGELAKGFRHKGARKLFEERKVCHADQS